MPRRKNPFPGKKVQWKSAKTGRWINQDVIGVNKSTIRAFVKTGRVRIINK